ncbi:unnamed protein product [Symbiodinium sp. CCMP2456]|nr:unnamed protein product [Symbiodinium sp. CCMP2456]
MSMLWLWEGCRTLQEVTADLLPSFSFGDHEGEHFFEILKVCALDLLSGADDGPLFGLGPQAENSQAHAQLCDVPVAG